MLEGVCNQLSQKRNYLMNETLVLNKSYMPIHIIGLHKTMKLIYQGHAKPLDDDYIPYTFDEWVELSRKATTRYQKVKTINYEIAIPEIVMLLKYNSLPIRDVLYTRQNIFQRDKYICQYCGKRFSKNNLTKDHVIPKSHGGKENWENIVTSCLPCNIKKRDRTPSQAKMKLLNRPDKPSWLNPFSKIIHHPSQKQSWRNLLNRSGIG